MASASSSSSSSSAGHVSKHSGIQAGRITNYTVEKDVRKRLRIISPQDPESARQYLLYVFRKHDSSGRGTSGTISHKAFRDALANFDATFSGSRSAAVVDILVRYFLTSFARYYFSFFGLTFDTHFCF